MQSHPTTKTKLKPGSSRLFHFGAQSLTTNVDITMKKSAIFLCISIPFFLAVPGCSSEPGLPEVREPRCEPRSTSAPARLNIETSAANYGMPPCEATVHFAIMRNSELRSLEGSIEIIGPEGSVLHQDAIQVFLEGPDFGTFQNEIQAGSIPGQMCRNLTLDFELLHCGDEDGNQIECPEVRVKESFVLKRFTTRGTDLNVCFDD